MSTPLPMRVVEHQIQVFKQFWRGAAIFYIATPALFLLALGVGLGGLIDKRANTVDGVRYLAFVAPGLMAASAMQGATAESLWPIMAGTKWLRTFHAMVATPLRASDVYLGIVAWTGVRVAAGAALFLGVAAALGAVPSPWGVLAVPAAAMTAVAFAAPMAAFAATQETDLRFPVVMRIGVLPLFLFSGAFFPITQLPRWLRPVAEVSPLYHGVELCRAATTGRLQLGPAAGHVLVLLACIALGVLWGRHSFTRKLTR